MYGDINLNSQIPIENLGDINIVKFILLGNNKNVNDMYHRTFQINSDYRVMNQLENAIDKKINLGQSGIIKECNNLISLTGTQTGLVDVPYGWNQKRLSFVLVIEAINSNKIKDIYFLNGYSDYYDPLLLNASKNLSVNFMDPRMNFNINTITTISEYIREDGTAHYAYKDKITVLKKHGNKIDYEKVTNPDCTVRSSDVLLSILEDTLCDSSLTETATESDRSAANTLGYITSITGAITTQLNLKKYNNLDNDINLNRPGFVHSVLANTTDNSMLNCKFLAALYRVTGEVKPSSFTIPDLLTLFPQLDFVTTVFNLEDKKEDTRSILASTNLENTINPHISNLLSLEFYQIASSILFDNMLTRASIHLSNHPFNTPVPVAHCISSESIFHSIFNTPATIEVIDSYLSNILLPKMTKNQEIFVDILADVNILGMSTVAIMVNDEPPVVYRYNSSMDNTYSPFITNTNQKSVLTDDINTILDKYIN